MTVITRSFTAEFAAEVRRDLALTPKQLQSKYLYDALGSSLFEAICRLPWYRITRAETRLLAAHAPAIVVGHRRRRAARSSSSAAAAARSSCSSAEALQALGGSARVHLIDISSQALEQSEQRLGRLPLLGRGPSVDLRGRPAPRRRRRATAPGRCWSCCSARTSATSTCPRRRRSCSASAAAARARRPAAARRRSRQARSGSAARLRRSARRHRRLQQEPAGPDQPRARRQLRSRRLRAPRGVERGRAAHRDAPGEPRRPGGAHPARRHDGALRPRRARSGPRARTSTRPDQIRDMGAVVGFAIRDQWIDDEARFALTLFAAK